jgi:prophage antirepressor-like protein
VAPAVFEHCRGLSTTLEDLMLSHNAVDEAKPIIVAHRFNDTDLLEIEYEGRPVFLAQQVGLMLGYADAKKLTNNLTDKWDTDLVEGQDLIKLTNGKLASFKRYLNQYPDRVLASTDPEGAPSTRAQDRTPVVDPRASHLILLTESGAQLVAMLARTHQGRAFRRWLVDVVLPSWRQRHQPPAPPAPPSAPAPRGRRPRALPAPAPAAEAQLALAPAPRPAVAACVDETVEERLATAVRLGGEPARVPTHRELLIGQVLSVVRGRGPRAPFVAALASLAGEPPAVIGSDDPEVIAMTQAICLTRQLNDAQLSDARRRVGEVVLRTDGCEPFVAASVLLLMRRELIGMPDHILYDVLAYAAKQRRAAGLPPAHT